MGGGRERPLANRSGADRGRGGSVNIRRRKVSRSGVQVVASGRSAGIPHLLSRLAANCVLGFARSFLRDV